MNQFPYQPLKEINSVFDKISLLFQTVLESEAKNLLPTVQLDFSWLSKCPIDKMVGSQGYQTVWEVPRIPCVRILQGHRCGNEQISKEVSYKIL